MSLTFETYLCMTRSSLQKVELIASRNMIHRLADDSLIRINIDKPDCVRDYVCMPELPEVESVLRSLRDGSPALPGRMIKSVVVNSSSVISDGCVDTFTDELPGMIFSSIDRHGKYLIFGISRSGAVCSKSFIVVHLRMTGRLFLVDSEHAFERHTRMALMLDNDLVLRFDDPRKFGRVWLVAKPEDVVSGLGPDALDVGPEIFKTRISAYQRKIKPLLLDQTFLSGIGNIYADEILYRAGIHPLTSSRDLTSIDVDRLFKATREVLAEAVDANGANIDGVFSKGMFVVNVYGREGQLCSRCGSTIIKIRVGQRGTHICQVCQPITGNYKI